jgi:hypothetical protein
MKIVVEAVWDDEAKVWVATSAGQIGLVTEAESIEQLQEKLSVMVPDLMRPEERGPFEIELVARSHQTIAAE